MSPVTAFLFLSFCGLSMAEDNDTAAAETELATLSPEELQEFGELLIRNGKYIFENDCAEGFEAVRKNNCIESCTNKTDASDVVEAWTILEKGDNCCDYKVVGNGRCPCLIKEDCKEPCDRTQGFGQIFANFSQCFDLYPAKSSSD